MKDVFISYSTENQALAEQICRILDENGITYWFAPRNIRGSDDFAEKIPVAIENSRVFLMLLSRSAQESRWVQRELGEADDLKKPIFTLFLEDFKLNRKFNFILRNNQHYVASLGFREQMNRLLNDLPPFLSGEAAGSRPEHTPFNSRTQPKKKPKTSRIPLLLAGTAAAIALGVLIWFSFFRSPSDGSYVIWNPAYSVALSRDTVNDYYRAGETVLCKGENLTSFSQKSVWNLDFSSDGSFTMTHNGEALGIQPGYNGLGFAGEYTADTWELVDAGDGYYYIRNSQTGKFLEWYASKNNWSAYDTISDSNREYFLLRLDYVD